MLKKIILTLLLVGFTGALIWGGVNRTLAKTNDSAASHGAETTGRGNQGSTEDHNPEDCEEDGYQNGLNLDTDDTATLGQSHGNSFEAAGAQGNSSHPEAESDHLGAAPQAQGQSRGNGGQGGGREPLDATEIEALYLALDDEYDALAVYQSVIDTFGPVEPFVEIAASEEKHIGALVNQLTKYGLTIPENPWLGNVPTFESVEQACATGAQAEIDNAGLYDQLFSMTDDAALIRVFTNLANASLNSHLPQFEACQ